MAVFRIARYRVRAAALDSCKEALHTIVDGTNAEPGTLMYLVLQDAEDPTRFIHLSAYRDEAALAQHVAGEPMGTQIREVLQPAMVDAAQFTHYTIVDGKFPATPVS